MSLNSIKPAEQIFVTVKKLFITLFLLMPLLSFSAEYMDLEFPTDYPKTTWEKKYHTERPYHKPIIKGYWSDSERDSIAQKRYEILQISKKVGVGKPLRDNQRASQLGAEIKAFIESSAKNVSAQNKYKFHKFSFSKDGGVAGATIDGVRYYVLANILIPREDLNWQTAEVVIYRDKTYYKRTSSFFIRNKKGASMTGDEVFMFLKSQLVARSFKDLSNGATSVGLPEYQPPASQAQQSAQTQKKPQIYTFSFYKEGGLGVDIINGKRYVGINGLYIPQESVAQGYVNNYKIVFNDDTTNYYTETRKNGKNALGQKITGAQAVNYLVDNMPTDPKTPPYLYRQPAGENAKIPGVSDVVITQSHSEEEKTCESAVYKFAFRDIHKEVKNPATVDGERFWVVQNILIPYTSWAWDGIKNIFSINKSDTFHKAVMKWRKAGGNIQVMYYAKGDKMTADEVFKTFKDSYHNWGFQDRSCGQASDSKKLKCYWKTGDKAPEVVCEGEPDYNPEESNPYNSNQRQTASSGGTQGSSQGSSVGGTQVSSQGQGSSSGGTQAQQQQAQTQQAQTQQAQTQQAQTQQAQAQQQQAQTQQAQTQQAQAQQQQAQTQQAQTQQAQAQQQQASQPTVQQQLEQMIQQQAQQTSQEVQQLAENLETTSVSAEALQAETVSTEQLQTESSSTESLNQQETKEEPKSYVFSFVKTGNFGGKMFGAKFYADIEGLYVLYDDIKSLIGRVNTYKLEVSNEEIFYKVKHVKGKGYVKGEKLRGTEAFNYLKAKLSNKKGYNFKQY